MGDRSKLAVRRKKVHYIEYLHGNPGRRGIVNRTADLALVERAGLGRLRGRAVKRQPNNPDDGGVAGRMAVRRIRAERSGESGRSPSAGAQPTACPHAARYDADRIGEDSS